MNRAIEFKCWDGKRMWKHAVPLHSPAFNGGSINASDNEGGSFNRHVNGKLLQYTGFTDSKRTEEFPNGQDIYEGDKVKKEFQTKTNFITGDELNNPSHEIGVIEFLDGCFAVKWLEGNNAWFGEYPHYDRIKVVHNYVDVIGNIYEDK